MPIPAIVSSALPTIAKGLIGGAAGTILGGVGKLFGFGKKKKAAKKQRAWQERMRGTAYQATMADMRAAGLNPILAYKQGATSAGQGVAAQVPDFGGGAAADIQAGVATAKEAREERTATPLRSGQTALATAQKAIADQTKINLQQQYQMNMGNAKESQMLSAYLSTPEGMAALKRNYSSMTMPRMASEAWTSLKPYMPDIDEFKRGRKHGEQQIQNWKKKAAEYYKHYESKAQRAYPGRGR